MPDSESSQEFKIGTRGSLLAVTQCTHVKDELEEKTSHRYQLEKVKTQGDLNTKVPLWQLEGKNFFTKELDAALLGEEVDMVVHSYKDLGSDRPDGLHLACVTKRTFPHDILLIPKDNVKKLQSKEWKEETFCVGTSSPRRICNVEESLQEVLPFGRELNLNVTTETLRGNINTRIQKLLEGNYHAIVLAMAGLERLARGGEEARKTLKKLIRELNFMVMPVDLFPPAASQGALAIECLEKRKGDSLHKSLEKVHDKETFDTVAVERERFRAYGGGCHLSVGIHALKTEAGIIVMEKGKWEGNFIRKANLRRESTPPQLPSKRKAFIGLPHSKEHWASNIIVDEYTVKEPLELEVQNRTTFVASAHASKRANLFNLSHGLFCSGSGTLKKLASQGHWVHACSDYRGELSLVELKNSKVLPLFLGEKFNQNWQVLGPKGGNSQLGEVIPGYQRATNNVNSSYEEKLQEVELFYWMSYPQYQAFCEKFPFIQHKTHCCGVGKTFKAFKAADVPVHPFCGHREFLEHITKM